MPHMIWRLTNQLPGNGIGFKLADGHPDERAYVLGLVVNELGNRATIAPSGSSYYNYTIVLADGVTYQWLHSTLWSLLQHRLGIHVILY